MPRWLLPAKGLLPNLLILVLFSQDKFPSAQLTISYTILHTNFDLNVNILGIGDKVTSAQLFMHKMQDKE